jgi:HK97 family phage prohead protease
MSWTRSATPVALDDRAIVRDYTCELRAEGDQGDGYSFSGYAAPFDQTTRIDSVEGVFDERIKRGAFTKTIREGTPVLQFDHGRHAQIGSLPIGVIVEAREDERGLFIRARLHKAPIFEPVREGVESGAIRGMSFRFSVIRDSWEPGRPGSREARGKTPLRTLEEVRVAELGPVVFPAYSGTTATVRDGERPMRTTKEQRQRELAELRAGRTPERVRRVLSDSARVLRTTTKAERQAVARKLRARAGSLPDPKTMYGREYRRKMTADQRRRDAWLRSGYWIPDAKEQARQRAWASDRVMRAARRANAPAFGVLTDSPFPRVTEDQVDQLEREAEQRRRDEAKRRDIARWGGRDPDAKPAGYQRQYDRHGNYIG